jgi:dihydrofolate synthase / folylpolyglutamate synthase
LTRQGDRAFDSYRSCLDWLFSRHRLVMKTGLERVEKLLEVAGHPERRFRTVHVGGTNGKGSTSSMIARMLSEHGLRTGLYTSPHVVDFTERITVDGTPIPSQIVVDLIERLKDGADEAEATFFEIATAAAALYFAEQGVDIVVAEVGLGGRLDATNALDSALSVITRIALDHTDVLGSDHASIAAEKAGIIRQGGVVVCGAEGVALDVIRGVAAARKARFIDTGVESCVSNARVGANGSSFDFEYSGRRYESLELSMLGRHQVANARNALVAVHEFAGLGAVTLSERAVRRGLVDASVPGRLQIIDRRPTIVADVAHNPDGAAVLAAALAEVFDYDRLIVVLGIMADKDARGFLAAIADATDSLVLMRPSTPRAAAPEDLAVVAGEFGIPNRVVPSAGAAIQSALAEAGEADLVLVTGSHYTVGDVMVSLGVGRLTEA